VKTRIVVDSSMQDYYASAQQSVFRALEHFGVYFQVADLAHNRISARQLQDTCLLVLAQENIGGSLDRQQTDVILKAVSQGMGMVVLDGALESFPASFLESLNIYAGEEKEVSALKLDTGNRITDMAEHEIPLKKPLPGHTVTGQEDWSTLLSDEENNPGVVYKKWGKGKIVFFLLSAALWQKQYLGFTEGLDSVFRNSIVWAAKKPYIMKSMPPFVTARIDDISFGGSPICRYRETLAGLKWLDILNEYGFIPNAGLFIDDIRDDDAKRFREKERMGLAEFSPHAFVDFGYREDENSCPIYMKHNGEEFTREELKKNFEKVDLKFAKWGIGYSKTVNVHFAEIGINSLPFIRERGQKYLMTSVRVGKSYFDPRARSWELAPYGINNFCFGYIPEDSYFFNVFSAPKRKDYMVPDGDMLYGCTSLHEESSFTDVEKAVGKALPRIRKGLESGFFGSFATHEQRIAHVSPKDWELIIKGISEGLKNIPHILASYDYISMYAENRLLSRVSRASYDEGKKELSISMSGRSLMKQQMYLFLEEGERIREKLVDIPEFEQSATLNFTSECKA
jgi:hypothetical protein